MKKSILFRILLILIAFYLLPFALCSQPYFNTGISNKYVIENKFLTLNVDTTRPPQFLTIKSELPEPYWPSNSDVIKAYWRIWELEFSYLHAVTNENKFVSPFIEPPFNGHIFMWDACFMTMFGKYGHRAFNFQKSLDNFYCKQHKDGYICREISIATGLDQFEKYDLSSTGPNLMPWAEWEYFLNFNDTARLKAVFPPLLAYYQWYKIYRSWPDGSYFSSGWGSGMDNQPRLPKGAEFDPRFSSGSMSWIDITLQQVFVGKILIQMSDILGRKNDVKDIQTEIKNLTSFVQKNMWDTKSSFFYDRHRDGSLNQVKSIAAFWSLLAEVVPSEKSDEFINHLENPKEFARLHRVPTLSADDPNYSPIDGYWCGPVWASTNYMVLRGLTKYGKDSLAHEIALNHVTNVVKVFKNTGTFWETYPSDTIHGTGMKNFLDWNGLIPINDLFEYVFGVRSNVPKNTLLIDVRLKDEYGINKYPFGVNGILNIQCKKRKNYTEKPSISIKSNVQLKVIVKWRGGELTKEIKPGKITLL